MPSDPYYSATTSVLPKANPTMRVLITGDDGPPSSVSPYVLGLYQELKRKGWDVSVVVPSSQKSWGGMHFAAHHPCALWYYYPRADNHDGSHPDTPASWSATRRAVDAGRNEVGEWVLMDASPASCANAGIFSQKHLFPDSPDSDKPFDLVISGPNYGRNTGTSFALGSGTVGAALAASLAKVKAISLSYGHFAVLPRKLKEAESRLAPAPPPKPANEAGDKLDASEQVGKKDVPLVRPGVAAPQVIQTAHELSVSLIEKLWNEWEPEVGVYTINVPLAWTLLEPKICWTTTWQGRHGRLYDLHKEGESDSFFAAPKSAGSDLNKDDDSHHIKHVPSFAPEPQLRLKFSPDIQAMLAPKDLPEGTDVWALMNGWVSVTRLRPAFAEVTPGVTHELETKAADSEKAPGSTFRL